MLDKTTEKKNHLLFGKNIHEVKCFSVYLDKNEGNLIEV